MKKFSIIVPIIVVTPNRSEDRKIGWARNKRHRENVQLYLFKNPIPNFDMSKHLDIYLTRVGSIFLDDDNNVSAFKIVRDTVADHLTPGLAPGRADNNPLFKWHYSQEMAESRGKQCIRIDITQE
jgi:hypothetical protein